MFKSVEYVGFEGRPELRAKAEQLTPVLADQIRRWREDVVVRWSPAPGDAGALNLTLELALENGVSGTALGTFTPGELAEGWQLRSRCRKVWSDLLGVLSEELNRRAQEYLVEPAEV